MATPLETKPAKLAAIPRGRPYRVKDGDDWLSVARVHGINVQYLISYNFDTLNTREVNWYLRHRVGCVVPSPKGWNWRFSSSANPGIIMIPPDDGQLVLKINSFTYSIATMSWIDPRSGLPEHDAGSPGELVDRQRILGSSGYRFANFLEATIESTDTSSKAIRLLHRVAYEKDTGLYRSPSFLGFPSYPYPIKLEEPQYIDEGVVFRQTVGARTQSAELAAGVAPAPIGFVAGKILQKVMNFPPIWTELKLTLRYDGTYEGELVAHSLYPSCSYYERSPLICLNLGPKPEACEAYERKYEYDGLPNFDRWFEQNKGWGAKSGYMPADGNPWGATAPDPDVLFGQQPPDPNEEARRPRQYPPETWRPPSR
ncbi:hypothetical protein [Labrys sp. ZIDIC5]|uniref:hypothetical protein n=1 Tax=Labrys sedimenti TaxID=3106036 RepID=UPI002AC9F5D4|nr:hypothetical protein [Labrys sp. ZIDIC5]MDZ5449009.1 hypothetical protein [Labrys sp. ZIDIC5]